MTTKPTPEGVEGLLQEFRNAKFFHRADMVWWWREKLSTLIQAAREEGKKEGAKEIVPKIRGKLIFEKVDFEFIDDLLSEALVEYLDLTPTKDTGSCEKCDPLPGKSCRNKSFFNCDCVCHTG